MATSARTFRRKGQPQRKEKRAHPFYNTAAWRGVNGLRKQQLTRQPLCEDCLREDRTEPATVADHITDHKGNWEAFVGGELRSLCHRCHSRKTMRENPV